MSELVVQYVQTAVAAATPWLAGVAAGFVLLWLFSFTRKKKPFAVTDFAVDSQEKAVAFEIAWATNLFADVDSRSVDLFMSTNLSVSAGFRLDAS